MIIRQIDPSEEIKLRRFITKIDPAMGLHSMLKDYFLAGSDGFGIIVAENDDGTIQSMAKGVLGRDEKLDV